MVERAVSFANKAHQGQRRKSTNIAYILHPMEAGSVASSILSQFGRNDEEVISAAILHDVLEDTNVTEEQLLREFGERVTFLVKMQSEDKSKSWKERKTHTIEELKKCTDIDVKIVLLADKLSNMRSVARDYEILGEGLWSRFNEKRKSEHGWYYESLSENMRELENTREHIELKTLINEVFRDLKSYQLSLL